MIHPSTTAGAKELSKIWNVIGYLVLAIVFAVVIWEPFGNPVEKLSFWQTILLAIVIVVALLYMAVLRYRTHGWN